MKLFKRMSVLFTALAMTCGLAGCGMATVFEQKISTSISLNDSSEHVYSVRINPKNGEAWIDHVKDTAEVKATLSELVVVDHYDEDKINEQMVYLRESQAARNTVSEEALKLVANENSGTEEVYSITYFKDKLASAYDVNLEKYLPLCVTKSETPERIFDASKVLVVKASMGKFVANMLHTNYEETFVGVDHEGGLTETREVEFNGHSYLCVVGESFRYIRDQLHDDDLIFFDGILAQALYNGAAAFDFDAPIEAGEEKITLTAEPVEPETPEEPSEPGEGGEGSEGEGSGEGE